MKTLLYSIMIIDTYNGFFQPTRGLVKSDPLSPYLFIVIEYVLSRLLKKQFESGKIGGYSNMRGAPHISHLLYVDDLLIFPNGEKRSIRMLMKTLDLYENWSS